MLSNILIFLIMYIEFSSLNIKDLHLLTGHLWGESTSDQRFLLTKGQYTKIDSISWCYHVIFL